MRRWLTCHLDKIWLGALLFSGFLFVGPALRPEAGEMLAGPDLAWFFHPTLSFAFAVIQEGTLPLWNPYLFLGFPQFAEPQLATFYPLVWLGAVLPSGAAYAFLYAFHLGLAAAGGYVLVRQLNGHSPGAVVAGLLLGFNGFMVAQLYAGHLAHLMTIAYAPWVLAAAQWAVMQPTRGTQMAAAVVAGLPLGLAFLAGYAPFFPLLVMAVTFLMGWRVGQAWQRAGAGAAVRVGGQWLLLGFVAGMVSAVQLLPTLQFALRSSRLATADYAFAASLSLPFRNLLTLLLPQLFGVPFTDVAYWAGPPLYAYWEHAIYVGILPLILFGLSGVVGKRSWCGWVWLGLVALLVALGPAAALHRLLFQLVPGFGLFRVPARVAYLFVLATAVLAGLMLDRWFTLPAAVARPWRRRLTMGMVWGVSGTLLLALLAVMAQGAAGDTEAAARLGHVAGQLVRLLLLGGAALLLLVAGHGRSARVYGALTVALLLVDLWGHGLLHLRLEAADPALGWTMADLALPLERDTYRVTSSGLPPNQAYFYRFQHLGGYDDFRLQTAETMADLAGDDGRIGRLLNIRYALIGPESERQPAAEAGWSLLTAPAGATIYQREAVQPRAFIVHQVIPVADAAEGLRRLGDESLDLAETAVVQARSDTVCSIQSGAEASAAVSIAEYAPQRVVLHAETEATGWLVLADLDYPGWQATVDGRPVPVQTTNYALRGLCVPAGEHEIIFRFRPVILTYGLFGSGVGVLVVLMALVVWLRNGREPATDHQTVLGKPAEV